MNMKKYVRDGRKLMILNIIIRKIKELQYKNYIENHRYNIRKAFTELVTCPDLDWIMTPELSCKLLDRIEIHDLSKYSNEEFDAYRRHFYPINHNEYDNSESDFNKAWEHHYLINDHHWQHRQNDNEFTDETVLACLENICDWLAMGYKYNDRPIDYYTKHKDEIKLPQKQLDFMIAVMQDLEKTKRDMAQYGII